MTGTTSMVTCDGVSKWFGKFQALANVSLDVARQEVVVVCGPSGSGKSTLIRCINRLEQHDKGTIVVDGVALNDDLRNIAEIRREVGMVFQQFNLFPPLTVLDNVTLAPRHVRKAPRREAEAIALEMLERVKIPEQARKYPGQLSGGQQQRVAIARAVVTRPAILLADEPTGNLDTKTSREIMSLLASLNSDHGITVLMVTHESEMAQFAKRVIRFVDGRVESDAARLEAA